MQRNSPSFICSHEDLEVYQIAFNAAMEIFELSKNFPKEEKYALTDQIRRSSRSVCANLAEAWRSGGSPRRTGRTSSAVKRQNQPLRKTQGNVHQERRRYQGSFLSKLKDAEAEAAESQVWLKFAVKCEYLDVDSGRKLYSQYNQILGLIVIMTNNAAE